MLAESSALLDLFGNSKIVIPAPDQVEGRLCRESRRKKVKPDPLDSCLRRNDGFRTSLW